MKNIHVPPSKLNQLVGTSDIYSYLNNGDAQSLMDEITEDVWDKEAANVTIYVTTAGSDTTGDGTVGNPYASIARAFKDTPIRSEHQRTIQLGTGTFEFPENWTNAFVGNGHWIKGTTSVGDSHTISSINTSSRDNGLILTVAPDPGWGVNALVGQHIKFTSGALNNTYGVIYENTSDTIYVSNAKNGAWTNPAPADTFAFHTLDTTINNNVTSPDRIGVQFSYLLFQDINMIGGYIGIGYSTVGYIRSNLSIEQVAVGAYSRAVHWTCYLAETNVIPVTNVIVTGEKCRFEMDYGSVANGQNRAGASFGLGGIFTTGHDTVLANFDSGGFVLQGNNAIYKNSASDNLTLRFYNCAAGFISASSADDIKIYLPYIAGDITGNFLANLQGKDIIMTNAGGSVTTALGTNTCTVDGTNEGYRSAESNIYIHGANDEIGDYRTLATRRVAGDITVTKHDFRCCVTDTSAPRAVSLPDPATLDTDQCFEIADESGGAGTNNITITPAAGNINGAGTYVISTNYECITVQSDGTNYFII